MLRNITDVLRHDAGRDGALDAELVARLAEPVTRLVAEIAILDRVTDPADDDEYVSLACDALGLDPWDVIPLWRLHAVAPIQAFAASWSRHQEQAGRRSEPSAHHHVKIVDLAQISHILKLTRPRIREVFGKTKCVLDPVRMVDSQFTTSERAEIRELSARSGYSKRWIKELALVDGGEENFCKHFIKFETIILPADVLDRHRLGGKGSTDLSMTRFLKRFRLVAKPGPKPRNDSIELQVASLAKDKNWSVSKTYRKIAKEKAVTIEKPIPKNVELGVTMTVSSRHDDSEFVRSATSTFQPFFHIDLACPSLERDTSHDDSDCYEISETEYAIAAVATTNPRSWKKRREYNPEDIEALRRWYQAERGLTLKPETYRQWTHRGVFNGYLSTARSWLSGQDYLAMEMAADAAAAHVTKHVWEVETNAQLSARSFRGHADYPVAPSIASPQASGASDGG